MALQQLDKYNINMGNPSSKSSFKNNNLSKEINFMGTSQNNNSKNSGVKEGDRDHDVLTKFTWNYGGNSVFLTGSFNNWKKNIPMQRQGDQFAVTLLLPRQVHQYKFIVDGEWRFSPEDATMSDDNGFINNFIDTTNFEPLIQGNKKNDIDDFSGPLANKKSKQVEREKGKNDKKQQYAKYAPKLVPHYEYCLYLGKKNVQDKQIPFNNNFPQQQYDKGMGNSQQYAYENYLSNSGMQEQSNWNKNITFNNSNQNESYQALLTQKQIEDLFKTPHSLPMPTHVTLDHVLTQQGDWYSAMAITQRFKEKYTTFTYYTIDRQNTLHSGKIKGDRSSQQSIEFQANNNFSHRHGTI